MNLLLEFYFGIVNCLKFKQHISFERKHYISFDPKSFVVWGAERKKE